ncbi:MAG TPA: DUF5652 family protein [Patescibacteria group bacterium]|nr:DUF5652 family protein [Patescibacteria group bacterium]
MENIPIPVIILTYLTIIWVLTWKGIALWHAAQYKQRNWFIILLASIIVLPGFGLFGLIDIIYLFFFAKTKMTIKSFFALFKNMFSSKEKSK